jgi:DNA repair exonuclease SbcCD nuclease subunit
MIRFAFYTDIHLSGKTPKHRIDDYPVTMIGKLREVYETAESVDCQFVLFGGDFFNTHRIFNYDVIGDAQDIICESRLKTYACIGEHDLYGHSPNTYKKSTLAFLLRRCPSMEILWEPKDLGDVVLHAKHEWEDMHEALRRDVDTSRLNVLVCHELITCGRAPFDVISTATLKPSPYDLVVSGDLHDGYEPHEVDGTWFCNPGSLARRASDEVDWWPEMAVIDIEKGGIPIIDIRRLKSAKPGSEVFGETVAELVKAREEFDGSGFAEELLEFEAQSVDVHDLIQKTGKSKGLRKRVLDYLASKKKE